MFKTLHNRLGVSLITLMLASSSAWSTIVKVNVPDIEEDANLNVLSTQLIRVERIQNGVGDARYQYQQEKNIEPLSLGQATKSALDEAQWMEDEVLKSPALVLPIDFSTHKKSRFKQKMRDSFSTFSDEEYKQHLEHKLSKMFPVLLHHVAKNQFSNNWKKTNVEKVMVSFGRNTKGDLIVYLDPLKIGLPVYKDQRLAEKAAFTPYKVTLSKQQEDSLNFLLYVMCNKPEKLMDMVSYRSYHPEESLADSQYFFTYGKHKALEVPKVVQIDTYAEKRKAFDRAYIERSLLPILQRLAPTYNQYKTYDAFTKDKGGSGYYHGQYMYDYWQTWLDYSQTAKQYVLPRYELPLDLIKDKTMYDRQFVQLCLLPTILKFYPYDPYKSYRDFIKPNNGSGYKIGMDLNTYWQTWVNSRYKEATKQHPLKVYQPTV